VINEEYGVQDSNEDDDYQDANDKEEQGMDEGTLPVFDSSSETGPENSLESSDSSSDRSGDREREIRGSSSPTVVKMPLEDSLAIDKCNEESLFDEGRER
jgi:hypothetical protein